MKNENKNVVICPPCGENVGLPTKRGAHKGNLFGPLLPRLTAVLPPQGREITAHGFTLIELLVVVLIIGILAAVAVPQYQKATLKTKGMLAKNTLEQIIKAEKLYYLREGKYAYDLSKLDIAFSQSAHYTVGFDSWNKIVFANVDVSQNKATATLVFYYNGRRDCRAQKTSAGKGDIMCQALGYKHYPNEDNNSWTMYH